MWHLGPVPLRAYAFCIIAGIFLAIWVTDRRWRARGGSAGTVGDIALWAVPFGIVGGRIYHVVTSPQAYFGSGGDPVDALRIWNGGLGIWGAVLFGALGAWIACRRRGIPLPPFGDALAPGLALAQAVGRWGNWFNQELFGRPTDLPWGLEIDPAHRPRATPATRPSTRRSSTSRSGCIAMAGILVWADRRFRMGHGRVFALYVVLYTRRPRVIETVRIDEANTILGLRVNVWVSGVLLRGRADLPRGVGAAAARARGRRRAGRRTLGAGEHASDDDAPGRRRRRRGAAGPVDERGDDDVSDPGEAPSAQAEIHHDHQDVSGGWLRAAVFGAMDGLVSNLALISGMAGGSAAASTVALAGVAGLAAGAFSMAAGEYVSVQVAERAGRARDRRRARRDPGPPRGRARRAGRDLRRPRRRARARAARSPSRSPSTRSGRCAPTRCSSSGSTRTSWPARWWRRGRASWRSASVRSSRCCRTSSAPSSLLAGGRPGLDRAVRGRRAGGAGHGPHLVVLRAAPAGLRAAALRRSPTGSAPSSAWRSEGRSDTLALLPFDA